MENQAVAPGTSSGFSYFLDGLLISKKLTKADEGVVYALISKLISLNCKHPVTSQSIRLTDVTEEEYKMATQSNELRKCIAIRKPGTENKQPSEMREEDYTMMQVGTERFSVHNLASIRYGFVDFHEFNENVTLVTLQVNIRAYEMFRALESIMITAAKIIATEWKTDVIYIMSDGRVLSNNHFAYFNSCGKCAEEQSGKYIQGDVAMLIFDYVKDVYHLDVNDILTTIYNAESIKFAFEDLATYENEMRLKAPYFPFAEDEALLEEIESEQERNMVVQQIDEIKRMQVELDRIHNITNAIDLGQIKQEDIFRTRYFRYDVVQ